MEKINSVEPLRGVEGEVVRLYVQKGIDDIFTGKGLKPSETIYQEISEELGMSVETVKLVMKDSNRKLGKQYFERFVEPL